jgi:predicted nucleic acid-binding protein
VIVCDTGPIFAAADRKDADHHVCVELFTGLRLAGHRLLVPQTVLAEVGYMLATKLGTVVEVAFLESVVAGSFELVGLTPRDVARVATPTRSQRLTIGTFALSVPVISGH